MYTYSLVQRVYNWGASYAKVILRDAKLSNVDAYFVHVQRYDKFENLLEEGERKVLRAYHSDQYGNEQEDGTYVTLDLDINANLSIASPFYGDPTVWNDGSSVYLKGWAITKYTIRNMDTDTVYDVLDTVYKPDEDGFLPANFKMGDEEISYLYYEPKKEGKHPLIIWLHGYGSGGHDLGFVSGGMLATNFITPEIQGIFDGAHVIMPQAHTAWMDDGSGTYTKTGESCYSKIVDAMIQDYMDNHEVDFERVYVCGCSNGGFMTLRLILDNPERYAAGIPICPSFKYSWLHDEDVQKLKDMPLWFVHALNDPEVKIDETSIPIYERLKKEGNDNLHFTPYDKIVDPDFGNEYSGHFAWVYALRNLCREDIDARPVFVDGEEVTLFEWLAAQKKD